MKILKKIFALAILGVVLEAVIFLYLNNIFLKKKAVATFKNIETKTYDNKLFSVAGKISNIKISYDNKYAVYEKNGELEVYDIENKAKSDVPVKDGTKIKSYDYMPYEDKLFISECDSNLRYSIAIYDLKLKNEVKGISSFNINAPDDNTKNDLCDVKVSKEGSDFLIKGIGADSDVINYRGDRMNEYDTNRDMPKIKIGEFFPLSSEWSFVLQNSKSGEIYIFNEAPSSLISNFHTDKSGNSITKVNTNITTPKLLYVDEKDNIYIGSLKQNKIAEIECKSLNNKTFKKYTLKKAAEENNIKFLSDGSIFAVEHGQIRNLKNNKITKINGDFIQIQSNKIFYKKGNSIMEKDVVK